MRSLDSIALGEFPPSYALNISGSAGIPGGPSRSLLWQGPTLFRTLRTTSGILTMSSTAAADAGLLLIGFFLDSSWKLRTFNCTFPVGYVPGAAVDCIDRASGSIITRAIRMWGLQVVAPFVPVGGSDQSFAGTVRCEIGGDLQDILVPTQTLLNASDTAAVSVPAGFTLLMRELDSSVLSLTANYAIYVEIRSNSITSSAQGSVFASPPGFGQAANGAVSRLRVRSQGIAVVAGRDVRIVGINVSGGGPENIMADLACTLVPDTLTQKPETTGPPDALPRPGVLV